MSAQLAADGILRAQRWSATAIATVCSTYLLDAVATAAGLLLVASQLLQGRDGNLLMLFLAASYVAWGAGLRASLGANWALLERTGTSTSVFSKAAHSLASRATENPRIRRIAAAAGYVGTEVVKETPYYLGAFGALWLTDTVSAGDAVIFLAGANLGAAGYEYGLARGVRVFLGRADANRYASFDTDWEPKDYLSNYYADVEPDERHTIAFFVEALRGIPAGASVLLFGVGPTLHHVFLAAGKAGEIDLGDYLPANLREIERWIGDAADAHDWRPFVRYTLECEGRAAPADEAVAAREALTRARITNLLEVDLRYPDPLAGGRAGARVYDVVISAYCADSATDDRATWETYMRRIIGLVAPGGTFLTAALRHSRGYVVGDRLFPSANVGEADLRAVLEDGFGRGNVSVEVRELNEQRRHGYAGIILARADRRPGANVMQVKRSESGSQR